jgi:hypothetical protein
MLAWAEPGAVAKASAIEAASPKAATAHTMRKFAGFTTIALLLCLEDLP